MPDIPFLILICNAAICKPLSLSYREVHPPSNRAFPGNRVTAKASGDTDGRNLLESDAAEHAGGT